jgi:hypothetical protein
MNIFLEEQTKPLTTKRKLQIWAMLFIGVPAMAWLYGHGEYKQSDQRRMMMPVSMALPAELPIIWEF